MADQSTESSGPRLIVREGHPLIGVPAEQNGQEVTVYYTDDRAADSGPSPEAIQRALGAIGAWSHLDFDEMLDALDRIRHESTPTPLIEDL